MNEQVIRLLKLVGQIVGGIILVTGLIGGIWSLWDRWEDRKPRLELFVPEQYTGTDTGANQRFLAILVRISNSSTKNAYLCPETMAVKVKIPVPLQRLTEGKEEVEGEPGSVISLIEISD